VVVELWMWTGMGWRSPRSIPRASDSRVNCSPGGSVESAVYGTCSRPCGPIRRRLVARAVDVGGWRARFTGPPPGRFPNSPPSRLRQRGGERG
jgi:hypothetical protein